MSDVLKERETYEKVLRLVTLAYNVILSDEVVRMAACDLGASMVNAVPVDAKPGDVALALVASIMAIVVVWEEE